MAFAEAEIFSIATILGTTPTTLNAHITSLGATVTAALETAVRTQLTRWTTAGINFVSIEPKESNFGARVNPDADQADIRKNIALLLEWPYMAITSMGTLQIG